jgi:hypothetical protein
LSGTEGDVSASQEALGRITEGIGRTLAELRELGMTGRANAGRGFSDLALNGLQTGHDGLTSTLNGFCERWEWGVRKLVGDANEFAADVGLAAGSLHETDRYVQGSFKILANAGMGNPYASDEEVVTKDWAAVLSENSYTQIRDADYSGGSFDEAREDSLSAWQQTLRDANDSRISPVNRLVDGVGLGDDADRAVDRIAPPPPAQQGGGG